MSLRLRLVLYLLLGSNLNLQSAIIITGNAGNDTQTTNFAINAHVFDIFGGPLKQPTMYIGAKDAAANNAYAVSRVNTRSNTLQPLTPSNITLNEVANQSNPLNGAQINFLKLNGDKPVVLINGDHNIYKYNRIMDSLSLISAGPINDTNGASAGNFLALAAANDSQSNSFVAVTPNGDPNFGGVGSGIALFEVSGNNYIFQNASKAAPLDNTSSTIGINNNVTLANTIDLHWSGELNCLFVALQATAGSGAGNGARSIVVGKVTPVSGQNYDTITFSEFVPSAAITGNNQIIGTATANATVTALKIKTMATSTRLNYLIVLGGNAVASNVGNQVYALPLVTGSTTLNGTLAKYDQDPTNIYTNNFFTGRTLPVAASVAADLLTTSDLAARVGGGVLPLNSDETVTDLFTAGDSVYASIGTTTASHATGIFQSQAILNEQGLIVNWTKWQNVGGFNGPVFGAAINSWDGSYWYLTGTDVNNVQTINKTLWSTGNQDGLLGGTTSDANVGLVANLSNLFPAHNGGLFNLVNIAQDNPALNGISLLIGTGYGQIALINPDAANAGNYSAGLVTSNNDTYPSATSSTTIANITGPNLSSVSALTQAHIATNGSGMSWLVVSGSQGVAILRQNTGDGWSVALSNLGDLDPSFSFKLFHNYQFVQKLSSDQNYLYILTQTKLDRIPLNSANFITTTPVIETIAEVGDLITTVTGDVLNDVIVTGDLAILATSAGLLRVANGSSISNSTVNWTPVTVPEQIVVPSTKLISVAPQNGLSAGGNLYLVSSYRGFEQTIINRFYVNLTGAINDATVLPLPDLFVKNNLSYFINFESFKDNFWTDGTLLLNSLSKDANQNSYVQIMPPGISSGNTTAQIIRVNPPYNINLPLINAANLISNLVRSTNAGALIVSGEFGIVVNE